MHISMVIKNGVGVIFKLFYLRIFNPLTPLLEIMCLHMLQPWPPLKVR